MAYGDFKDLTRRTASDKILHDKTFNIVKNPKYDGYWRSLASNSLIKKKTSDGRVRTENKISNKKLGIRWRITQINY